MLLLIPQRYKFSSKSQLELWNVPAVHGCCWYHKGTNFQANHNEGASTPSIRLVVADTTKVQIFKQITTFRQIIWVRSMLLLIPQRYKFSSKSQHGGDVLMLTFSCCWYHKGTNFQANHNQMLWTLFYLKVVADTTKVQIFKQITTCRVSQPYYCRLLLIPQRYKFSSKSQQSIESTF